MRKIGATFELKERKEKELLATFRENLYNMLGRPFREIMQATITSPSSCFWVSEERATDVIEDLLKGKHVVFKRDTSRRMYEEILARVVRMQKHNPEMPLRTIIRKVIEQPAPEFYITPESAHILLHYLRHKDDGRKKNN